MLSLLPKIGIVLCVVVFAAILVKVLFFTTRKQAEDYSKIPLERDHEN